MARLKVGEDKLAYTHADVMNLCLAKAEACGWKASVDKRTRDQNGITHPHIPKGVGGRPDLILEKAGRVPCALEIKSSYDSFHGLKTGLGQCLFYHVYDVNPYLVFPDKFSNVAMASAWTLGLGFISFSTAGELHVVSGTDIFQVGEGNEAKITQPVYIPLDLKGEYQLSLHMYTPPFEYIDPNPILAIDIRELRLSVRAYNVLHMNGYKHVRDLLGLNRNKLSALRNVGIKTCAEIAAKQKELLNQIRG